MDEMNPAVKQEENIEPAAIKPGTPRWYEGHISLEDAKTFIKANITTAARSFIAIGFYLKCVRDRELFLEEEYSDVWEFARSEYGISKSTASRYMSMNDRFSENGNSPNIKEEYRAFGKSQLQEMLYLEDDQLDQVGPDDRVEDIRNLRRPKEIPYVALPGQMEIEIDFPEILPGEQAEPEMLQKQTFEMNVEELLADEGQEGIAISQQSEEEQGIDHFFDRNESIDDAYGASRAEIVRNYLKTGYKSPDRECEVVAFGSVHKVLKKEDVTVFHDISGIATFDVENSRLKREHNFFFGAEGKEPEIVIETPKTVPEQPETVPESPETVIDGEFEEILPEPELTAEMLFREEESELNEWLRLLKDEELDGNIKRMIGRKRLLVEILSSAAQGEKATLAAKAEKQKQPELPLLKNNDQRAAFVDAYETWPLWIETAETGERYYRYDLPDGTSMVVKVYHALLFDYKAIGKKYEDRFREGCGKHEYYFLQEGRFFKDCETSRSDLIEKLKELQKRK